MRRFETEREQNQKHAQELEQREQRLYGLVESTVADEGALQFVVISLKDNFYDKAHGLVGIYRDRKEDCSKTLTLSLEALDEDDEGEEEMDDEDDE